MMMTNQWVDGSKLAFHLFLHFDRSHKQGLQTYNMFSIHKKPLS